MLVPLPTIKPASVPTLDAVLEKAVADGVVPALFLGATNAKETIYYRAGGLKNVDKPELGEVDEDTVTECYSQTKFVTALAVLQLVDAGLVALDSADDVARVLPELASIPLLKGFDDAGAPILVQAERRITLRHLLSHSSGLAYGIHPLLETYLKTHPVTSPLLPGSGLADMSTPLMFEPGTSWTYGVGIDWAGVLVHRVSGLDLEEYFQKHIFGPLGLKTFTFYPTKAVHAARMSAHNRKPDGTLVASPLPGGFGLPRADTPEGVRTTVLQGGAGLFGTQKEFLALLRAVLASDPRNADAAEPGFKPLISAASYAELWRPALDVDGGNDGIAAIAGMVTRAGYFGDDVNASTVNHSVAFLVSLTDWPGRRKAGSGTWSGMAKTQFWLDPTTGVAAVCGTQVVSAPPDPFFALYVDYERTLYAALQ
ncbi:hypothetical protein Q5752_001157 [Cryptotrichosporon argae]